jgi:RNA polymerase sigma-70 factor, ECF subfamily
MVPAPPEMAQARALPALFTTGSSASTELEREVVVLFEAHRARLLAYILAFGISSHDGEEILQEVFLSLFRHLQMGRSRHNLRGWIFRVAHNLALKHRQANQRWQNALEANATASESYADPSPNPEEHALSVQRQMRLTSVVSALPEQDQWCLRLRAEGLRYREIANVVGISLGSVSISLTRSLARLMRAGEL